MPEKKDENVKKSTFFYPNLKKEKVEDLKELRKESKKLFFHFFDYQFFKLRTKIRRSPKEFVFLFLISFVISSVVTTLVFNFILSSVHIGFALPEFKGLLPQKALFSFETKNKLVDPYEVLLRLKNHKNDFILVDIRSREEYEKGHILSSINIPGYSKADDLSLSASQKEKVERMFSALYSDNKQIIIYAQTSYSTIPLEIAKLLGHTNEISLLKIGYNEWAHMKTLWVPEAEWTSINPDEFVQD